METKQFNEILVKVPGSFKAKLERIRRYLYLGKVSVMVGAGFSTNADAPTHIKVKQWNDVGEDIFCRLQAVEKVKPNDLVFKTPMRLASQFAAVNGRSELDNLIRDSIPDDLLYPGALHRKLLSLPWRDVFTTNYDTLLERARQGMRRNYSVVTSKEMLLYKDSPRIIKLHGSFPDKTPFLMTEEDYMTYPVQHPAFVNTVRQALVESVFCLIGFSGDDPNFTSWQAWLRDVMGDYAGPSYLITCDEHYDDGFKTLMKQRGIEVVNFSEIDGLKNDYKNALDFFFTYLSERETVWSGRVEYPLNDIDYKVLIDRMRKVRESYPGWFVLPKKHYADFTDMEYDFPYLDSSFKELNDESLKEGILYELDWRADKSLSFKDIDWFRQALETLIANYADEPLSEKAISLGISLLRLYRGHFDKTDSAAALRERLSRELPRMSMEQYNRFYYTIACNALSLLDYNTVNSVLKIWSPSPSHYEGIIYKALVNEECGNRPASVDLLNDAFERISLSLSQTTTQEEQSLRAAIEFLLASYSGARIPETEPKYSFLTLSDYMLKEINKEYKDGFEIEHGFAIGSASHSWHNTRGTNRSLFYPYRFLLLCESYGFPFSMASRVIDEESLAGLLHQLTGFNLGYSLGVALRSHSRRVVTASLDRQALNTLSREQADILARLLLMSAGGKACRIVKQSYAETVLQPLMARLASMCSSDVVIQIFKFVHATYREAHVSNREDMQIIYNSIMPDIIQVVFDDVFDSEIFKTVHGKDVPLPQMGVEFFYPSDKAINIACNGLLSEDKDIRQSAFNRVEILIQSKLRKEQKEQLSLAIRKWRTHVKPDLQTRVSYNAFTPDVTELPKLKDRLAKDLETFVNGDYNFKSSSLEVSAFYDNFYNITVQASYLTKEQTNAALIKIVEVLDNNFEAYSKDDSESLFGGMRRFVAPIFSLVGKFVSEVIKNGYAEKQPCATLFNELHRYLPSNLPVRVALERLNSVSRSFSPGKIREEVVADITSDNDAVVIDCCNALISYAHDYFCFQTVLQDIIFYCTYAVSDNTRLYLQTLRLIPIEKMTPRTQNQLAIMLKTLMTRITKQKDPKEWVDIMHDGVSLAASLKNITKPTALVEAVKLWGEYAQSDDNPNDIRNPWYFNNY